MKKYRQLITGIIIGVVAFVAAFVFTQSENVIFNPENDKPAAQPVPKTTVKTDNNVYLITMDQMDRDWIYVHESCVEVVNELRAQGIYIDYRWLAPDVKDDAKQIECINDAVANGADVILLAANGPDAVTSAIREAEAAGVKIIYVGSAANYPAIQTLATDNRAAGETAGVEMLAALRAKGITSGKIGIVGINAATASVAARKEGFRAAFVGTGFEILETPYGEGDISPSADISAIYIDYITQGVVGILGVNEGSTVGVGAAIKEADVDIIGVGFDKSDAIMGLIADGYLFCTIIENPEIMGYEGMKTAAKVLKGEAISEDDKVIDTGVTVIKGPVKGKVYLITIDFQDMYWATLDVGCRKAAMGFNAQDIKIDYTWLAPDVKDDAKQIECINNAVDNGADVILLAANGRDAVTSALREAEAAGVKIIYVDSPANFPAIQTLATDNREAGRTAGKEMLAALQEKGLSSGKIGIVNVNAATAAYVLREEGFREVFAGTGFAILETQYGEGAFEPSKDFAADYITQGCVGIFGTNEVSTVGVGSAIKEAGGDIIGVGFDKSDYMMMLIDGGYLLCTMVENPDIMGYEGMKTAAKVLKGEAIPEKDKVIDTGVTVIKVGSGRR